MIIYKLVFIYQRFSYRSDLEFVILMFSSSQQFLAVDPTMWRSDLCQSIRSNPVNPMIIVQDVLCCFHSFFSRSKGVLFFFLYRDFDSLFFSLLFSYFCCRWRGALHHPSYKDDDGGLVDVCSNCHILIYCQSSSFPHNHAYREFYTVSIQLIFFTYCF